MEDKEYNKLKKQVIDFEDKKISDIRWDIGFLVNLKDKNNKKDFVSFWNSVRRDIANQIFDKIIWDVIDKKYLSLDKVPSFKEAFGIMEDRIKSNEKMIEYSKKEILKHKKEIDKINDYDKRKEKESEIWWDEHHLESYGKEIHFYKHIKDCIKSDMKSEIGRERRKENNKNIKKKEVRNSSHA